MSIDRAYYDIYEACEQAGWKVDDPTTLATALRKIRHGFPAQDEFCLMMSWLGRCRLIHGLNQHQYPPAAIKHYRVPDLLAVFEWNSRTVPVLIEVKSTIKRRLSWRPDYYEPLLRYGDVVGLPVLVAWRSVGGMWALVDLSSFKRAEKNYRLTFDDAMGNSLLSLLAGDFLIRFKPGFGLHLHFRKEHPWNDQGGTAVVEEAYFISPNGNRFNSLGGGLWPFFMRLEIDSETEETATHVHQSFTVREKWESEFAHRGFQALLPGIREKSWRVLLEEHKFKVLPQDLREAAAEAHEHGAVTEIMNLVPRSIPEYLQKQGKEGHRSE